MFSQVAGNDSVVALVGMQPFWKQQRFPVHLSPSSKRQLNVAALSKNYYASELMYESYDFGLVEL